MSDTESSREAKRKCLVEGLNLSQSECDHSSEKARYQIHKNQTAREIIGSMNDCNKGDLYLNPYSLVGTSSRYDDQGIVNVALWA